MSNLITGLKIQEVIEDYNKAIEAIPSLFKDVEEAQDRLEKNCHVMGTHGQLPLLKNKFQYNYQEDAKKYLTASAWRFVYGRLNIEHIAPQTHLKEFEKMFQDPIPFTYDNIRDVFKEYMQDPRKMALQAFAEVFNKLDPFYKSHDNFRVGVKGLPKRVIIGYCSGWHSQSGGYERVADVVNAIMRAKGRPDLVVRTHEASELVKKGGEYVNAIKKMKTMNDEQKIAFELPEPDAETAYHGLTFKHFQNENVHIMFDKETLKLINQCLAEYYGEVLPDAYEHTEKKAESTEVAKDLQFYPTPKKVAERLCQELNFQDGDTILEPSCGEGAIMETILENIRKYYNVPEVYLQGVEVHQGRANKAREKGFPVVVGNFLQIQTEIQYDKIIMNPPFYGKHYEKHVRKAYSILKEGGTMVAVLPITARDNHKLLDDLNPRWYDLPVGSFRESGTNINTVICKIRKM